LRWLARNVIALFTVPNFEFNCYYVLVGLTEEKIPLTFGLLTRCEAIGAHSFTGYRIYCLGRDLHVRVSKHRLRYIGL
jgi:hypothetical protein